jgi:hypothetical protein
MLIAARGYIATVVRRMAAPAALAAVLVLTGCRPSAPDQSAWRSSAEQAVSDMVSEVATSRLTARKDLDGRLVGRYAVVVLTYSEEAAGKASDSVSTLQPPPAASPSYTQLTALLSDAADAISQARIAVADGDDPGTRRAVAQLSRVLARLRVVDDHLQAAR